jgi:hypothetical protein
MRILLGIPVAVVLMLVTPSVAFAWGAGGGGASVPAFGALWQEPSSPEGLKGWFSPPQNQEKGLA